MHISKKFNGFLCCCENSFSLLYPYVLHEVPGKLQIMFFPPHGQLLRSSDLELCSNNKVEEKVELSKIFVNSLSSLGIMTP